MESRRQDFPLLPLSTSSCIEPTFPNLPPLQLSYTDQHRHHTIHKIAPIEPPATIPPISSEPSAQRAYSTTGLPRVSTSQHNNEAITVRTSSRALVSDATSTSGGIARKRPSRAAADSRRQRTKKKQELMDMKAEIEEERNRNAVLQQQVDFLKKQLIEVQNQIVQIMSLPSASHSRFSHVLKLCQEGVACPASSRK